MITKTEVPVHVSPDVASGSYSNMARVIHPGSEEFIIEFFMIAPPSGVMVSRIICNPGHAKRLLKALQENVRKYEDKFGKIEPGEDPPQPRIEVGFHPTN